MQQDQNSVRLGSQRQHLLHMVLTSKLQSDGSNDVSPQAHGIRAMRAQSPSIQADDVQGQPGFPDVQRMGLLNGSPSQFGRVSDPEAYSAGIEDRKHLPDSSNWGMLGANKAIGGSTGMASDQIMSWAQPSPLEGSPAGLLSQQANFDEHSQDTEVDAPMANLQLQHLQCLASQGPNSNEGLVGSWPGSAGYSNTTDTALPFFQGRPIRTSSNLSNMSSGVQHTSSFTGHPGSAHGNSMAPEHSFAADHMGLSSSCNSAPLTPRSPAFGYEEHDTAMALAHVSIGPGSLRGPTESRHGPSKLRMSSSDAVASNPGFIPAATSASLAATGGLQGMGGLDSFTGPCQLGVTPSCGTPDPSANLMAFQQQQAAMQFAQQPGLLSRQGTAMPQPPQAAAMAQAAALMATMGQDPNMQGAASGSMPGYNMVPAAMMPDAGVGGMNQMQMLMYYAQLGMMSQMHGANGMGVGMLPGTMPNMPNMSSMMFPMMTPQQLAAFCAAGQQHWQAGMPASAIANIAAAAAAAATAATNCEDPSVGGRNHNRARGPAVDRPERRLRCDKGNRGSSGRLDDIMGSPTMARCDPLLEEYKNNRTCRWEMRDILGHMMEFSLDQLGSRFIQQKLDTLSLEELEAAFAEIAPKGLMLMNDVFGNYVIQKFLDMNVEAHRQELAQQMKGQVLSLSLQLYSCRVIQKALEVLPLEQKIGMVAELDGALMRCVRDQNGNHVIQKVIECVPTEHITNLLDTFSGNLVSLSQHPFGCRVMQRILEHCTDQQRYNCFMTEILKATVQLAQDQYGNYVIQHVVEQGKPHERDAVYDRLFPHIVVLSQNKFASNVVEKMLLQCTMAQRGAIVEEFLRQPGRRSSNGGIALTVEQGLRACEQYALEQMMQDQYGNYVVQKTLEVCDESQRERLLSRVRAYYEILKTSQFGKHIVNRLEKLLSAGMRIQVNSLANPISPQQQILHQPQEQQQQEQQLPVSTAGSAVVAGQT